MPVKKRGKGTRLIGKTKRQTGVRKSKKLDRNIKAKLPGKRRTKKGNKVTYYTETRKNRSDRRGSRL